MRKIQANVSVGNVVLHSRNYIKARPQVNENGMNGWMNERVNE